MNSYIVSLKFAPGLVKEFTIVGDSLAAAGHKVYYLLASDYKNLVNRPNCIYLTKSVTVRQIILDTLLFPARARSRVLSQFQSASPDIVFIYNPHPLNNNVLKLARIAYPAGKRIMYVHEPFKADKTAYGLKGYIVYGYLEYTLKKWLKLCTQAVMPSTYAMEIFHKYYRDFHGSVYHCPLLGPDIPGEHSQRKYFAMVGRFNYTKPLMPLINLVNYCTDNNLDYQFAVTTASEIGQQLQQLTNDAASKLMVNNPPKLTDSQINNTIAASLAVFCLHENVVQSGVIPTAYMNSTPVIVRNDPGFTQHVRHGYNGYILPDNYTNADMVDAMRFVTDNFSELSTNARKTYESVFSMDKWYDYYYWLDK